MQKLQALNNILNNHRIKNNLGKVCEVDYVIKQHRNTAQANTTKDTETIHERGSRNHSQRDYDSRRDHSGHLLSPFGGSAL